MSQTGLISKKIGFFTRKLSLRKRKKRCYEIKCKQKKAVPLTTSQKIANAINLAFTITIKHISLITAQHYNVGLNPKIQK